MTITSITTGENWVLVGIGGPVKGRELVFIADEVRIGRTAENDIVIPEKSISRHHASFFIQGDLFWVQDMNSKNGTFINQQKITKHQLHKNDVLKIGDAKFKVAKDSPQLTGGGDGRLRPLIQAMAQRFQGFKHRKVALYSVGAILFIALAASTWNGLKKDPAAAKPSAENTETNAEAELPLKPIDATDQQVNDWMSQADAVLQYEDYNASLQLLRKVVAARSSDLKARSKLKQVEGRLKSRISLYSENGAREFEKLNYDKAMMEWRIVLALSKGFDDETYKRTGEKIREAEDKLKQKKK